MVQALARLNALDLISKEYGVKVDSYENPLVAAVGVAAERVVPNNPRRIGLVIVNLSANAMQFSTTPDKIMFVNLPPVCTIKIYSENGNLVKTILHSDGKSDEQWGDRGPIHAHRWWSANRERNLHRVF
jgi:hypothetical protein